MPRKKKKSAASASQPSSDIPRESPSPSPTALHGTSLPPASQVLHQPRAPPPPPPPAGAQQQRPLGPPPPQLAGGVQVGPRAPPPWQPRSTGPPGVQQQSLAPPSTGTTPAGHQPRAVSGVGSQPRAASPAVQPITAPVQHRPRPPSAVPAAQIAGPSEAGTSSKAPTLELGFKYADPCAKLGHPRRPGLGKLGTRTVVKANHFSVTIPGDDISHYHVEISPETRSKRLSRVIISKAVTDGQFGGSLPAYDGQNSLYTARALSAKSSTFQVVLSENNRERKFGVTFQLANTLNMTQLEMFFSGRHADIPQEVIQAFDIVLRATAMERYSAVGRSFFCRDFGYQRLSSGLETWNGYFQSVRPTQSGLCLNMELSTTAFIQELRVHEYVVEILDGPLDENRPLSDADLIKVQKRLQGLSIEVMHRGGPRRPRYTIKGLSPEPTRNVRFEYNATQVSIEDYFMEKYGLTIQFPFLPCLQVGKPERPNYLPMEVCKIAPRQRYTGKLDDIQVTKPRPVRPDVRERKIVQGVRESRFNEDPYAGEFGISVNPNLMLVDARVLPSPELKFGGASIRPRFGRWDLKDKKLAQGVQIQRWSCISFTRLSETLAKKFCDSLIGECVKLGLVFNPHPVVSPVNGRLEAVESSILQLCSKMKQPLELLIVILPDWAKNRVAPYSDVKRVCETRLGIISQCCLEMNAHKMDYRTLGNIALKINAKLGGRNAALMDAVRKTVPVIGEDVTIVFGADVTHPSPGADINTPSIAAVVASMDWPEMTKYAGVLRAQERRKEIIDMAEMIRELLIRFYHTTGRLKPKRLIFYRDGVSEGQFDQVVRFELDAIFKAFKMMDPEYKPPVTFVIVQKRHHTRLFPRNYEDAQNILKNGNILPGTVVDTQICHPHDFDFYLCSHAGIQGTSRPAHYHVLHDENNFDADSLQKFTHDLCYTYARSTTAVSYVPPAYYAHLAAFRARYYVSNEVGADGVRLLSPLCNALKPRMFYC